MLNLRDKNAKELRQMLKDLGLAPLQHETMEQMRARIVITMEPGVIDALSPPAIVDPVELKKKPTEPVKFNTPQEVMAKLEPFKARIKLAFYNDAGEATLKDATTWHVKNGPAEDSGSLSVPLKWIVFKAQEIANARHPAVIKGEFEQLRTPVLGG